jgi:dynactin complex subunit
LCSTRETEIIRKLSKEMGKDKNIVRKIRQGRHRLVKIKEKDNEIKINVRQEEINVDDNRQ